MRQLRNRFTKEVLALERKYADPEEFEQLTVGSLKKAVVDGDTVNGSFMAGQIAGMIEDVKPAGVLIEELFASAQAHIKDAAARC